MGQEILPGGFEPSTSGKEAWSPDVPRRGSAIAPSRPAAVEKVAVEKVAVEKVIGAGAGGSGPDGGRGSGGGVDVGAGQGLIAGMDGDDMDSVLSELLFARAPGADGSAGTGPVHATAPTVLDCGGGSGRRAVPLALRGAAVTVIDSSIDALAILQRRAVEAGVADRVTGVQADVETLADCAPASSVDLILLHEVLDSTQDPFAVLLAAAGILRPGGFVSVVVPNIVAGVLARALSGDLEGALDEAERTLRSDQPPLDLELMGQLATTAGLDVVSRRGIGVFSSLVPGTVLDGRPGSGTLLARLDGIGGEHSPYREIAGRLHLLARRPF